VGPVVNHVHRVHTLLWLKINFDLLYYEQGKCKNMKNQILYYFKRLIFPRYVYKQAYKDTSNTTLVIKNLIVATCFIRNKKYS
jgi:hypothetical protein